MLYGEKSELDFEYFFLKAYQYEKCKFQRALHFFVCKLNLVNCSVSIFLIEWIFKVSNTGGLLLKLPKIAWEWIYLKRDLDGVK